MVTTQLQELIAKNQLTKYSDRLGSKALTSIELCEFLKELGDSAMPLSAVAQYSRQSY
jgi:hypothetical protein